MKPTMPFVALLCFSMVLAGCRSAEDTKLSDDVDELHSVVELDLPSNEIRWEIFGTPEYSGVVPAPTDFVTLVAEVSHLHEGAFGMRPTPGMVWTAPEAARPWLSQNFRSMLGKHRNASVDLSSHYNCRAAYGTLKKGGRRVHGFICKELDKGLIYLTLAAP